MTLGDYTKTKGKKMAAEILDENVEVVPTEQNSGEPKKKKFGWNFMREYWAKRKNKTQNPDESVPEAEVVETVVAEPVEELPVDVDPVVVNTDDASVDAESGNSKNKPGFVARLREKRQKRKEKRRAKKEAKRNHKITPEEEIPVVVVEEVPVEQLSDENNNHVDIDPVVVSVEPVDTGAEDADQVVIDDTNGGGTGDVVDQPVDEDDEEEVVDDKTRSGKAGWIVGGAAVLVIAAGVMLFNNKRGNGGAKDNTQPVTPVVVEPVVNPEPTPDTTIAPIKVRPQKPVRHGEPKWKPGDPKPKHLTPRNVVQSAAGVHTR